MFKLTIIFLSLIFTTSLQTAFAALDFSTIKTQAALSNATYLNASQLEKAVKTEGGELIHQTTLPESQVSYFLSRSNNVQTIAIRGTDNLENTMVNLNLSLQPDDQLNIILHQGFALAAQAIYEDVKPYLIDGMPIQTTGHSLGGAISVILAMYLTENNDNLTQAITFGQPKVTNVAGAKKFSHLPLIRVVTAEDIVPLVPPISPMQIQELDIYWHIGEEVILLDHNEYSITSGVKSMLRATKFTSSVPSEKNLNAHKMENYLRLITGLSVAPTEIPYKAEINFWGISIN
jgi:predicted lipase